MRVETQGVKEIREAVLIAGLSAVVTGLVNWAIERSKYAAAKAEAARQAEADRKAEKQGAA